jgi:hypothetical protein
MKRVIFLALLLATIAGAAFAQNSAGSMVDRPILSRYDLDTPTITATTNYVVTSTNVVNSTYTIAHQPDTPRNVTGTVTDTTPSVVGGTITIVGTDVNGNALTDTWTLTSLTFTGTKIFKTITSITGAGITVLGGAGDETVVLGVGAVTGYIYCSLGDALTASGRIKTSSSSTTVTAVTGLGQDTPFDQIGVGDEIVANGLRRTVTAKASGASITVGALAIDFSGNGAATGFAWQYRTLTCGYADTNGWINVKPGLKNVGLAVLAGANTGGITYSIETDMRGGAGTPLQLATGTLTTLVVPGLPDRTSSATYLIADAVSRVRLGLKFATTDDVSDTVPEAIEAYLTYESR